MAPVGWEIPPVGAVGDSPGDAGEPAGDPWGSALGAAGDEGEAPAEQAARSRAAARPAAGATTERRRSDDLDMASPTADPPLRFRRIAAARPVPSPRLPADGRRVRAPRSGGSAMGVIIIREMVGTSPTSWSDAARQAVATASRTVRNIRTVEVVKSTAVVENGEIVEYRVELRIGFEYEG